MNSDDRLNDYLAALASRSSTPGGGAAAAISGAQAASLLAMVCHLTKDDRARAILESADAARAAFLALAEDDARCFDAVMAAWRLSGARREEMLEPALEAAAEVPLRMIEEAVALISPAEAIAEFGNPNLVTDTAIAALLLESTIAAARLNVLVNLKAMKTDAFRPGARIRLANAEAERERLRRLARRIDDALTA